MKRANPSSLTHPFCTRPSLLSAQASFTRKRQMQCVFIRVKEKNANMQAFLFFFVHPIQYVCLGRQQKGCRPQEGNVATFDCPPPFVPIVLVHLSSPSWNLRCDLCRRNYRLHCHEMEESATSVNNNALLLLWQTTTQMPRLLLQQACEELRAK